jgi:hypothetical protein
VKYGGGSWLPVGSSGFSAGRPYFNQELGCGSNGIPYVVMSDRGQSDMAALYKYNGSSWTEVYSYGYGARYIYMDFDGVVPYFAFANDSGKINVMKYAP